MRLEKETALYDPNAITKEVSNFTKQFVRINEDISDLMDSTTEIHFYNYEPTTSNVPASTWNEEEKESHIGDLFYNTSTGYAYRWMKNGNVFSWERIVDQDVVRALANASKAQDTADKKRRVFTAQPTPPYDEGDVWFQGTSGDIVVCTTPKADGASFSASDWSKLNKYTDDNAANAAQRTADGKNKIFRQTSTPTASQGPFAVGDLWFDIDDDNKIYRYNGSSWVGFSLGNNALESLSASKLTAGEIDASVIRVSNIDAGNITGGYLNANRIETGSLSIGKVSGLQNSLNSKVNAGDSISVLTNDGTYATGIIRTVTLRASKTYTYSEANSYIGLTNNSWDGISSISSGWKVGDFVSIPCTISDRNNATARFLCRIKSYSGTTLVADNLSLEIDPNAGKHITTINNDGVNISSVDSNNSLFLNSSELYFKNLQNRVYTTKIINNPEVTLKETGSRTENGVFTSSEDYLVFIPFQALGTTEYTYSLDTMTSFVIKDFSLRLPGISQSTPVYGPTTLTLTDDNFYSGTPITLYDGGSNKTVKVTWTDQADFIMLRFEASSGLNNYNFEVECGERTLKFVSSSATASTILGPYDGLDTDPPMLGCKIEGMSGYPYRVNMDGSVNTTNLFIRENSDPLGTIYYARNQDTTTYNNPTAEWKHLRSNSSITLTGNGVYLITVYARINDTVSGRVYGLAVGYRQNSENNYYIHSRTSMKSSGGLIQLTTYYLASPRNNLTAHPSIYTGGACSISDRMVRAVRLI